ncbi:MAG: hypothetical protein HFJ09_16470 [Lachnospiraceae bacterium]|nr:hypothetical protein [Lachnospiraceae bacterium]
MYYSGMTGTRNVPMQARLEGMGSRTLERKEDKEVDTQSQQEQAKKREDTYKLSGDMQYLVEAETVSNIEEVKGNLQDKKLEISNSDMDKIKKKISLQQLQSMEDRCNIKIKKLRLELSLEKMIVKAEEDGDKEQARELRQEYVREKNLRKTEEYSDLQHFLTSKKEANTEKKTYSTYNNAKQKESKLLHEMKQVGNFVDLQSI